MIALHKSLDDLLRENALSTAWFYGFTHSGVITVCAGSTRLLSPKQEHLHQFDCVR